MDTSTNAFGVFSPPGSKTHPQFIRFIDSGYRELFKIPDGANVKIVYPPGDGRDAKVRECKYIDDHHLRVGSETYHICEFAERMERIGAKCEPEEQLQSAEILPFSPGEEKYLTYNREENNTCAGHIAGDFGESGDRFYSGWNNHITKSERDWTNTTPEFRAEVYSAVYALRQELLKDCDAMIAFCKSNPEAKLQAGDNYEIYGFKLETSGRRYFINCFLGEYLKDARFIIYAYEKAAPALELLPGSAGEGANFYRPDTGNPLFIGNMRGDFGKSGDEFWHNWFDGGNGEKTADFKAEFQAVVGFLRENALKDLQSSQRFCRQHPEAQLIGDAARYGFKLETAARQYFVRCSTLPGDYFYIYAFDKASRALDRHRPAEKPSVLKQIREARQAPPKPRKAKTPSKRRSEEAEL
ncbi:MAG: hypothetical protein LBK56_12565 [Gracilibacteraceae bacterium]|jgi:hypothetical protein|nr:hypothetical protein [Gracilibacteraceae bacterium]